MIAFEMNQIINKESTTIRRFEYKDFFNMV